MNDANGTNRTAKIRGSAIARVDAWARVVDGFFRFAGATFIGLVVARHWTWREGVAATLALWLVSEPSRMTLYRLRLMVHGDKDAW